MMPLPHTPGAASHTPPELHVSPAGHCRDVDVASHTKWHACVVPGAPQLKPEPPLLPSQSSPGSTTPSPHVSAMRRTGAVQAQTSAHAIAASSMNMGRALMAASRSA